MMLERTMSGLFWFVVFGLAACRATGQTAEHEFSIEVSLLRSNDRDCRLKIDLTNVTSHSIAMHEYELPWGNANSLTIRAMTAGLIPQNLRQLYAIDDPDALPNIAFLPGETRKGEVDLVRRLPTLWQVLRKTDVIVFWLYQLNRQRGDARKPDYYGGMVVIRGK